MSEHDAIMSELREIRALLAAAVETRAAPAPTPATAAYLSRAELAARWHMRAASFKEIDRREPHLLAGFNPHPTKRLYPLSRVLEIEAAGGMSAYRAAQRQRRTA